MFSNLTVTQKGLILVLVPVIFEIAFCAYLSSWLSDAEKTLTELQTSKAVLLKLHEFESCVARSTMLITNPNRQDPAEIIPQIEKLKGLFRSGEGWVDLGQIDPELKEVVEDSRSMRASMLQFLEKTESKIAEPNIGNRRKSNAVRARSVAGIALSSHELTQRVVQIEEQLQRKEPEELNRIGRQFQSITILGLVAGTLLTISLAVLFTQDILVRLRKIAEKAHLVSGGRSLPMRQKGKDEISQLDEVVHETSEVLTETRRKEVAILDNAADVICSIDERLRFSGVSATVDKIWNYSQDDLLGSPIVSLVPKSMQTSTVAAFERIAGGSHKGEEEIIMRCKDGSLKNFSWSIDWSAAQKTYFCVAHDVTERRALEKLKQQFLSMVSHDLRAPVTATSISISLLISGKRGQLSEDVLKILQRTETSIVRLTELVNDLLELDKLEAGNLVLNRTTTSAFEVCTAAKEALEAMSTSAYVRINGPSGDAAIDGDELRLVQAVINLLSNAIKFSPKNGTVTLSIAKHEQFIELRITDEGPGIEREDAALIFEKFRQSRTAKQTSVKSTGLGLAIVKAIAEAHGGEVGVDSEPGKGSTFWIRVPAAAEDDTE